MNKKAQMTFSPPDFSQSAPTEISSPPNLFQRIAQGIAAVVFLILFSPVIVGVHTALSSSVCGNPTVCLFYKFIVPAFILGGIIGAVKYMWSKQ
jgi:lipopolysaccharide/colanic/teichoic acid biosynthesis glycosyltransferase